MDFHEDPHSFLIILVLLVLGVLVAVSMGAASLSDSFPWDLGVLYGQ